MQVNILPKDISAVSGFEPSTFASPSQAPSVAMTTLIERERTSIKGVFFAQDLAKQNIERNFKNEQVPA